MSLNLKFVILLAGILLTLSIFRLLKNHSLHPSYAVLWLAIGIFLLTMPFIESLYGLVARKILGLYGGDHLIYITLIGFMLIYIFYLTSKVCMMSDRISKLISFTAVLENEIINLKTKFANGRHDND